MRPSSDRGGRGGVPAGPWVAVQRAVHRVGPGACVTCVTCVTCVPRDGSTHRSLRPSSDRPTTARAQPGPTDPGVRCAHADPFDSRTSSRLGFDCGEDTVRNGPPVAGGPRARQPAQGRRRWPRPGRRPRAAPVRPTADGRLMMDGSNLSAPGAGVPPDGVEGPSATASVRAVSGGRVPDQRDRAQGAVPRVHPSTRSGSARRVRPGPDGPVRKECS